MTASATAQTGTFDIGTGTGTGSGWSFTSNLLSVNNGADIVVTGTTSGTRSIAIATGAATITLDGASITTTSMNPPILLNSGANLTLNLAGANTLATSIPNQAGIQTTGATLTINGLGSLTVSGGHSAAGIGGGHSAAGGTVTINGGTVTATGGHSAAGIGGGHSAAGGTVTINGGTVTATGGNSAAGIGGGYNGAGGNITIDGGVVTANGGNEAGAGNGGAGIGGGGGGAGGTITIKNGTVTAKGGTGTDVPDIGGATGGSVTISGGTLNANNIRADYINDYRLAPTITTTALPNGTYNAAYSETLEATATSTEPIAWSIISGDLPDALSLNSETGEIFGTPTKAGTFDFTVQAANDHEPNATQDLSITIDKAAGVFQTLEARNATFTPTLTLANIALPTDFAWNEPTTAITAAGDGQSFPATFTHPSGNYLSASGNITVNVAKATQTPPNAPTAASKTTTSITLVVISGAEYRRGETGDWQDSPAFTELTENTPYTFFARLKGDANHNPSPASAGAQISTNKEEVSIRDVQEKGYALFKESVVSEKMEIMPEFAVTEVIIYDVLGNVVHNSAFRIPNSEFTWNLRNSAGRFAANGSYLVVVEAMDKDGKKVRYSGKVGVKR